MDPAWARSREGFNTESVTEVESERSRSRSNSPDLDLVKDLLELNITDEVTKVKDDSCDKQWKSSGEQLVMVNRLKTSSINNSCNGYRSSKSALDQGLPSQNVKVKPKALTDRDPNSLQAVIVSKASDKLSTTTKVTNELKMWDSQHLKTEISTNSFRPPDLEKTSVPKLKQSTLNLDLSIGRSLQSQVGQSHSKGKDGKHPTKTTDSDSGWRHAMKSFPEKGVTSTKFEAALTSKPADILGEKGDHKESKKFNLQNEDMNDLLKRKELLRCELHRFESSARGIKLNMLPDGGERIMEKIQSIKKTIKKIEAQIEAINGEISDFNSDPMAASKGPFQAKTISLETDGRATKIHAPLIQPSHKEKPPYIPQGGFPNKVLHQHGHDTVKETGHSSKTIQAGKTQPHVLPPKENGNKSENQEIRSYKEWRMKQAEVKGRNGQVVGDMKVCQSNSLGVQSFIASKGPPPSVQSSLVPSSVRGIQSSQQAMQQYLPENLHQLFAANPQAMTLYGGRMTAQRLREVGSVTTEAIDKLHKQLETCPTESTEVTDPAGLKVALMAHQRHALAWLGWREQQHPPGGILADDMGLGKTLTTLSHILRQKQVREESDSDQWLSRDKQVEKLNKAVKKSKATLIIAPASVVHQWAKEIERRFRPGSLKFLVYHGPNREKNIHRLIDNDVVLTTYSIISKEVGAEKGGNAERPVMENGEEDQECHSETIDAELPTLLRIGWERIVLDEGHNIKNHKSLSAMSICRLRAAYRVVLTGTPIQNNLLDMYSLLRFLRFTPFDEYKVWKKHVDSGKGETKKLNTIIKSLLLRRTKEDSNREGKPIVDLPGKTCQLIHVQLSEEERKIYDKVFRKTQSTIKAYVHRHEDKLSGVAAASRIAEEQSIPPAYGSSGTDSSGRKTGSEILVLLLRLRQCCSHLSLMKSHLEAESLETDGIELSLEEQMRGLALDEGPGNDGVNAAPASSSPLFQKLSVSTKLRCLLEKIQAIGKGKDKCVIVSQWTQMLDIVGHHLSKAGVTYNTIQGNIPAKKRMEIVDDFNVNPTGVRAILVSLRAGGVGLNLVGGNHLFLLDNHWNPSLEEQACDRIYRMGQRKDVFIYRFLCKDTIEEKIVGLQEGKRALAKSVLSGTGAKSQKLTLNDLRMLFGV